MITFHNFSEQGCKLQFLYNGTPTTVKVKVLDGYTKLTFLKITLDVYPDPVFWVTTPQNVRHKIYEIYDDSESELLFRIENFDGDIDLSILDPNKHFQDIGLRVPSHNLLAIPLYEVFCDQVYSHSKCSVKANDIVVDVGANIGFFTYKSLYDGAKFIYSIEPNKKLIELIASHNFSNVRVDNVALSDKTCNQKFYIGSDGLASCLERLDESFEKENETFELTHVNTVDTMKYIFDNRISKIDLLKIDCEGSEYAIIERIEESYLRFNIDRMIIEYHFLDKPEYNQLYDRMIEKISKCGFKIDICIVDSSIGVLFCWKEPHIIL
jgi:FkbM family methyltransferase